MSGTPIPCTLAGALYGTGIQVHDLEQPASRKPIQTAVFNNDKKIYDFILNKIRQGQQAYVVCLWIEDEGPGSNIWTVESTFTAYQEYFREYTDIRIGCITGKMAPEDSNGIIKEFEDGKLSILISTMIIEVGINVPNANIIVINNAERFGLAQLHQLRGRVGRGNNQGYCILKSADRNNERLAVLCQSTNGLEIAKEDMRLRGSGNLLGTEQSGKNEYPELIMQYPNMYQ